MANLCLTGDGKPVFSRGLCQSCRSTVSRLIKAGKTTMAELEAQGKILPSKWGERHKVTEHFLGGQNNGK